MRRDTSQCAHEIGRVRKPAGFPIDSQRDMGTVSYVDSRTLAHLSIDKETMPTLPDGYKGGTSGEPVHLYVDGHVPATGQFFC